jgi:hypothetical protein
MVTNYWYEGQLRSYILQFVSIFYGLQVQTGVGECGETELIAVPTVVGNKDRVVAAVMSRNTQNVVTSLPIMAAYMTGIDLAPERRRAPGMLDQRVTLAAGGVFPDDLRTVKRAFPVAYNMQLELSIYASNTQQMHQILEQILVLFNPDIQIQKSDAAFDWTRITSVELTGIQNEENYPSGTERRLVVWTLTFQMPVYIGVPIGVRDDLVRKVIIQIGDLSSMNTNEVDENGNLTPFGDPFARIEITDRDPAGPIPPEPTPLP